MDAVPAGRIKDTPVYLLIDGHSRSWQHGMHAAPGRRDLPPREPERDRGQAHDRQPDGLQKAR